MRPTFYLNLQVMQYEEDKGWTWLSEKVIYKTTDAVNIYEKYEHLSREFKKENSRKQRELHLDIPISGQGVTATHGGNQVGYGHLSFTNAAHSASSTTLCPSPTDSTVQQKTTSS